MMNWHIVTSSEFALGSKVADDIYFLSDTHEIYRGEIPYTEGVVLYTEEPTAKAINKLYINSTTLEGKIWNGSTWTQVVKPIASVVTTNGTNPVNGTAVAAYVAAELAAYSISGDSISSLSWASATHLLNIIKTDDTASTIEFDGLAVDLSASASNGKTHIQLLDSKGNTIGSVVDLDLERFVTGAEYIIDTKTIVLYFDAKTGDESTDKISIPVSDLVDTYTVTDTDSVDLTMANNNITATVKISTASGNTITLNSDGLYVANIDTSNFQTLVPSAVEDHLATLNADGQVIDSGIAAETVHETQFFIGTDTIAAAVGVGLPKQGDICVIKTQIGSSGKYEYTAYVYDSNAWKAMDGNYNAENIYFSNDLTTTASVGNITLSNGQATISAAGKNLKQVFDTIFVQEKSPTITQPSVSITATNNKAYEVGSSVTPSYSATLSAGSYQYGPATGITASSWSVTDTSSHSLAANTGSFDAFTVEDSSNYTITATATYGAGAIPVTNVGNSYSAGRIVAGSVSKTSAAITGYRRGFYGTLTSKTGSINSNLVRSLTNKTTATPVAGNTWSLSIPVGAIRVVFAYPATVRDINSVLDVNGLGAEIKSAFTLNTVDVEGMNGYTAKSYKVYVLDFASANDTANTYTIKL